MLGQGRIGQDQAIVLIRHPGLLLAPLAATGKPQIGDGRAPKRFFCQGEQAPGHGVGDIGDQPGHHLVAIAACHQLIQPSDFGGLGAGADNGGAKFSL